MAGIKQFIIEFSENLNQGGLMNLKQEMLDRLSDLPDTHFWNCGFSVDDSDVVSFHILPRGVNDISNDRSFILIEVIVYFIFFLLFVILLVFNYRHNNSNYSLKDLLIHHIPKATCLLLFPLYAYIICEIIELSYGGFSRLHIDPDWDFYIYISFPSLSGMLLSQIIIVLLVNSYGNDSELRKPLKRIKVLLKFITVYFIPFIFDWFLYKNNRLGSITLSEMILSHACSIALVVYCLVTFMICKNLIVLFFQNLGIMGWPIIDSMIARDDVILVGYPDMYQLAQYGYYVIIFLFVFYSLVMIIRYNKFVRKQ